MTLGSYTESMRHSPIRPPVRPLPLSSGDIFDKPSPKGPPLYDVVRIVSLADTGVLYDRPLLPTPNILSNNVLLSMSAVHTRGSSKVLIDGTDPHVSAEQIEDGEPSMLRVTIRPVPKTLKALFLEIQEKTLLYSGPIEGKDVRAVPLNYKSAWLAPDGDLERLVLTGPLPETPSDRQHPPAVSDHVQTPSPALQ